MTTQDKFTGNTHHHDFTVNDHTYLMRYCKGDICCDTPWDVEEDQDNDWPCAKIKLPDRDEPVTFAILGAIWVQRTSTRHALVAVWAAELGDGHVDFLCARDYQTTAEADLTEISTQLCEDICPEMADVFDDGSGLEREPLAVESDLVAAVPGWLAEYYTKEK
eukprot:CAMPEP_0172451314 /NCGR_PEP_ID=MMETSP1065-20121228/9409_1 /TAXON_ID=265537 /ORGANISM="Amphiprora paludosa, Strain CCMP125" /LENGTH=162 /DNA_ID=CAMNT_0013203263 /DNA_START=109 /DNA_END=597 /DNA_ORIENTATION=+